MTVEELEDLFKKRGDDEFLAFERIEKPRHRRPDLCAFLMLDELIEPEKNGLGKYNDMVECAEHDEIWLDVEVEKLAAVATEELVRDLRRCGVRFDSDVKRLAMFV